MRVLVLLDTLARAGAESVAVELACGLDRTRFAPRVLATRAGGALERRLAEADVPTTVVPRTSRWSASFVRRLVAEARDADVIHSHMFGSNAWGALAARRSGARLVAHEHNWTEADHRLQRLVFARWIAPAADLVLCVSDDVRDQLADAVRDGSRLRVLPNGVALDAARTRARAREELGLPADRAVVGIVAALREEKRHVVLVDALARLVRRARQDGETPPMLCLVGEGAERAAIEERVAHHGLQELVVLAGEVADAGRLVGAFDAFALPSRTEGMPISMLEAMAAGVPVACTDVGGPGMLAREGAALAVDVDEDAALAEALASLLSGGPQRERVVEAAGAIVRARYSRAAMVEAVQDAYLALVRAAPAAAGTRA